MDPKQRSVVLLVVGALLVVISATADFLGLGGAPGFGWKQTAGVVMGVVLLVAGSASLRRGGE
ncbi:MAG: hypothetical protein HRF46_07620 [Acidobacteriota bacterium]|jgi:tetrahydromethanopterin S-methyltransferase subunit D